MSTGAHSPPRGGQRRTNSAWAVGLAAAGLGLQVLGYAVVLIAYAVGGDDAISDNWVGAFGAVSLLGGLAALVVGFGLAAVAWTRHDRWPLLRLPLAALPAALAVIVLLELFVVE